MSAPQPAPTPEATVQRAPAAELATRLRQQAAVAEISQLAVAGTDLQSLMERAVQAMATTLEVEFCKVLELLPDGEEVLLRAGVGWKSGLVGNARVSTGRDSQAGYTLLCNGPVIVDDLRTEARFSGPPLLHEHGVVSGMSVVIRQGECAWGVLGVHTNCQRKFSPDDVRCLESVANVLGQAIWRKRIEEQLRQVSLYGRSLIEASLDPLVTISKDGKIMDVNQATELVTGVGREALIGSDFSDYFSQPEKARQGYRQVFAQGLVRDYPLAIRHASGRLTEVLYNATVYKNEAGEIEGVFAAARDITERKQAERRLYDQQFYTRSLIEASLDPLMTTNAAGVITDVNQQMELLTGCVRAQLIGSEFKQYCTEPERAAEGIRQVLQQGKVIDYELTVRSRDRRETVVSYNATVYRDWEGNLAGVFAAARDITERKRAQLQLQRYAAELARSNAELQDFASIASHDLQEPLRKVLAFGDRLQEHLGPQLDELGRDFLARMQNAAARMSNLIEALLEYSRISSRAQPFQPVDLQQVLLEVMADLETRIQEAQARVEVGPMPRLVADRTQLRQLLQNLLANAIKFHRPGTAPKVQVDSRALNDAWWEVTVRDDGIGFDERYLDRIFRPFQRLHGRSEYEGSGMGLAICRKIVARHGGDITARSQPGKGACFIVRLPAAAEERSPSAVGGRLSGASPTADGR